MLEEALQITRAMFRSETPTFEGTHYRVKDAINVPAPIQAGGPPIMIGGQGEKKTLRMMAQYAEMANFTSGFDELPHKLEVLAGHCEAVGRDIADINKTSLGTLAIAPTMQEAEAQRDRFLLSRGLDWSTLDDATRAMVDARIVVGDPDHVAERVQALLDLGLDGVCFNLPGADDLETVALAGKTISAVVN
jgi:alkanesulfonate monooxygenase SsuD/methylene tetrahydromethanopterin reductase-like flavin-dependent oxidoreductase (luciferase family)